MNLPQEQKFNSLIVVEGQDFREEWFPCLENLVQ